MKKTFALIVGILSLFSIWVYANTTQSIITVTIGSEPVLCKGIAPQECLEMTIKGEKESSPIRYDNIEGFEFKKWNTYVLEVLKTVSSDNNSNVQVKPYKLIKEVSRSFDAKVCTAKSYFDGCNTCMGTGDTAACTLMYCAQPQVPSCKYDEPLVKATEEKPTVCTMEYNPVCSADGTEYGNPCMAKAAGAKDTSQEFCKDITPIIDQWLVSHNDIISWANKNKLTMFTNWSNALVDNYTTREQAAKILVEFSNLYSPNRGMTKMVCNYNDTKNVNADLQWYLQQACNLRILKWDDKDNFRPYEPITQQELRLILEDILSENDKQYIGHAMVNKALLPSVSRGDMFTWLHKIYTLTQDNK